MKKNILISTIVLALASASVFAQGTIVFNNDGSSRVMMDSSAALALGLAIGTPIPKSSATEAYFKASLYYAAGPADIRPNESALAHATTVNFSRFSAGTFVGGNVTLTGVAENSSVWLQVRVWEAAYGNSYDEVMAAPPQNGRYGIAASSSMWNMTAGNSLSAPSIVEGGFTGFRVAVAPEPSTLTLGLLSLAGLLVVRRHR